MEKEIYSLIDTTIKIGLGACIAGVSAFLLSIRNHKNEVEKLSIQDRKSLVRELALKLEVIEGHTNNAAYHFHIGDLKEAKVSLIPASQDAYSARAIANILGSDELVKATNIIAEATENMYHALNESKPSQDLLDTLGDHLKDSKLAAYSNIRTAYKRRAF